MELVDGGTLRDVLRARGALGVPAAFAVMEQVLSGLAEAHRLGIVHRDVKPENVLISEARQAKVADFGLAVAAAQAGASHAGTIMGTVAYLSPEQVATGAADPRSDVYAAGILLYELLTGAPPYTGDTAISVAYRHVNCDVPAPSEVAGDVPPELDAFVQRATRREPDGPPGRRRRDAGRAAHARRGAGGAAGAGARAAAEAGGGADHAARTRTRRRCAAAPACSNATSTRRCPPGRVRARRPSRRVFALWITLVAGARAGHRARRVVARQRALDGRAVAHRGAAGRRRAPAHGRRPGARHAARLREDVPRRRRHGHRARARRPRCCGAAPSPSWCRRGSRPCPPSPRAPPSTTRRTRSAPPSSRPCSRARSTARRCRRVRWCAPTRGRARRCQPGSRVTLVVSRGVERASEQVRVPFLIGRRFDEAEEILDDLDLKAEERSRARPGQRPGGRPVQRRRAAWSTAARRSC